MAVISRIMSGQSHVTGHNARLITRWLRGCFSEIGFIAGGRVRVGIKARECSLTGQRDQSSRLYSKCRGRKRSGLPARFLGPMEKARAFGMTGRIGGVRYLCLNLVFFQLAIKRSLADTQQ